MTVPLVDLAGRDLVLASSSPRRRDLVALLGVPFHIEPADVDEAPLAGESSDSLVSRLAAAKANAVAYRRPNSVVIGADTIVDVDGRMLGKPADEADARRMLGQLSGRTHRVHTAVAVCIAARTASVTSTTDVTFVAMTGAQIDWYVGTGEPFDKAGAYGLQGAGGAFVQSVSGSVSGVLGLPLTVIVSLLTTAARTTDGNPQDGTARLPPIG